MEKKKKSKFSLRKLIYNDKYLIIISVICAVVIWIATSMNLSPETTKTITVPVPVDFSESAAEQLGLKCYGDESIDVDVTVKCKKYIAMDITAEDINVSLQTNYVTKSGNIDVPIRVEAGERSDFEIQSYYPTTYKAYFDVESEKVMDVELSYDSDDFIADGYIVGQTLLNESSVTVRGPKTYVNQVDKVYCDVLLNNKKLSASENITVTPVAVDRYGASVSYVSLLNSKGEALSNIDLTIPVLKQTVLPVSVQFVNNPAKVDTSKFDIRYSVSKVDAGVLDEADITSAEIGQIDFSKLDIGKNEFTFNVQNLDSIIILNSVKEITATVTVPNSYEKKNISVSKQNIKVSNLTDDFKYEVISVSSNRVTAIGKRADLSAIDTKNVILSVNATQNTKTVEEGTYTLDITPTVEGSDACWIYGSYTAEIRIYK